MAAKTHKRKPDPNAVAQAARSEKSAAAGWAGRAVPLGLILLATSILYLRCLGNTFVFDDRAMITLNRYIGDWSYLWKAFVTDVWWFKDPLHLPCGSYYRPLQNVWLAIHYHLFGLEPVGWHVTMVALHLVAVGLVFMIATELSGDRFAGLLAAALFGLMPAHVEAVVWLSAIPQPLSATLELAAFLLFIRRAGAEGRNWALAMALYAGALMSHESAVVFPILVALYVFLIEPQARADASVSISREGWPRIRRALLGGAPFAAEAFAYLIVRRLVLGFILGNPGFARFATGSQVLMTIPHALLTYFVLLVAPWMAGPAHRVFVVKSPASPDFYVSVAATLVLGAAFWAMVRNSRRRMLYLFCVAWIVVAVAPTMGLPAFQHKFVEDRYLYMASVGWCVLLGDLAIVFSRRSARARQIAWAAAAVIALMYGIASWNVQGFWHDETELYTRCIEMFPESPDCHGLLGLVLYGRGDFAGAEKELGKSLSLEPALGPGDSDKLYALGLVHAQFGHTEQAAAELARALKLTPYPPPEQYIALAVLYDAEGEQAQSEAVLREAESSPGGGPAAGMARAMIRMNRGDLTGAEGMLRDLTRRYPNDARAWTTLGEVLAASKRNDEALAAYHHAIELLPGDPRVHLFTARALHEMGRDREALDECRQALAIQADYAEAKALVAEIGRNSPQP